MVVLVHFVDLGGAGGDMDQSLRFHWDAILILVLLLDVVLGDVLQLQVLGVVVAAGVAPGGLGALVPSGVPVR